MKGFAILVLVTSVLTGCASSYRYGQFTVASTQNVRNLHYSMSDGSKVHTSGEACHKVIAGIIVGQTDDKIQRAVDAAISNGQKKGLDGDLLANVRINSNIVVAPFYNKFCVSVDGDLVKLADAK